MLAFPSLDCCNQRVVSLAPQCHGQEQGLLCFTATWSSDTRKEVGDMVLTATAADTPPPPGILSSSRRTTTCCLSWASSPSPVDQWCSVNMAEHGMKSVLRPGRLSGQQAKETLAQAGFPLQNYSQDKMCNSCHIVSQDGFGVKGTMAFPFMQKGERSGCLNSIQSQPGLQSPEAGSCSPKSSRLPRPLALTSLAQIQPSE